MSGVSLPHDWFPRPLPDNVELGARSWLYSSFAFLHCRSRARHAVRVGADSGIYAGSFFELGEHGSVVIGDFCSLVGATIVSDGPVVIEDFVFVAHQVVIADSDFAVPPAARVSPAEERPGGGPIRLGRNSWIGARAILLRGADIGEGAIVGAGAVVDFAVPPFAIVGGCPGRVVGSVAGADGSSR